VLFFIEHASRCVHLTCSWTSAGIIMTPVRTPQANDEPTGLPQWQDYESDR
jgi:hypothetical protein